MDWLLQAHCRYFSTTLRGRLPYCLCRPMFSFRRRRVLHQELRCIQPPDLKTSLIDGVHNDLSPSLMSSGPLPLCRLLLVLCQSPASVEFTLKNRDERPLSSSMPQPASSGSLLVLYAATCGLHPSRLFVRRAAGPQHASLHDAMAIHDIPIIISYCF